MPKDLSHDPQLLQGLHGLGKSLRFSRGECPHDKRKELAYSSINAVLRVSEFQNAILGKHY